MYTNPRQGGVIVKWWRSVDRYLLFAIFLTIAIGLIMVTTASPAVAERIGLDSFYFIRQQLFNIAISIPLMIGISVCSPLMIRRLAVLGLAFGIVLLICVLLFGAEVKGAQRWISIFGFSLQPSEFVKPLFIICTGWILAEGKTRENFPMYRLSLALYLAIVTLLVLQPDMGMTITMSAVWFGQLFLSGLPLFWILIAVVAAFLGIIAAYNFLPHVAQRINQFLDPDLDKAYQVKKSMEAFSHGGVTGKGPGEGTIKQLLPDSHTDFIFAVVGEELGMIACLFIIGLFAFIVIRGFMRAMEEEDLFIMYSVVGLLMQFGLQAIINMGVSLNLLPTKGMTLPFMSYGGSSFLAISLAMGMILALTRKRYGARIQRFNT